MPAGPVAVLAKKSPRSVAFILGCLLAGRPALLPSVDLGPDRLEALLRAAGCRAVFGTEDAEARYRHLVTGIMPTDPADLVAHERLPVESTQPDDDIAFMLTTSGSTGPPKVVPISAGAVARFTGWAADEFDLRPGSTVLNHAPLNFDLCLLDIWATLTAGGCVALIDQDRAASPGYLRSVLETTEAQVVQAVPMLFQILVEAVGTRTPSFPSVRHVIFTGDHLPRRTLTRLPAVFPNARLHNIYGCTETNDSFSCQVDEAVLAGSGPVPLGRPLPGVSALLMSDEGIVDGPGVGELWVSTPFQTTGYLGRQGPVDRFVRRRDGGLERTYFRTGDQVRRHRDGMLTLLGRNDFQVKVRGVAVNLQEIERTILEHDEVTEAAVVAVADELAGRRLHALVRRRPGADVNGLDLREYCAARLVRAAIPSSMQITNDPLPRTSTGKVDRQKIWSSYG